MIDANGTQPLLYLPFDGQRHLALLIVKRTLLFQEFRLLLLGLGELFVARLQRRLQLGKLVIPVLQVHRKKQFCLAGFLGRDCGSLKLDLLSHLVADVLFGGVDRGLLAFKLFLPGRH
jgi:hypothetical protein